LELIRVASKLITCHVSSSFIRFLTFNKKISSKRAKAVADRLKIPSAQVEGVGETEILYDNSTPEGRYYCRTVQITIETPIDDK